MIASLLPREGDRYHRLGRTVTVLHVGDATVTCRVDRAGMSFVFTDPTEVFLALEKKSLEWGARFDPAEGAR